MRILMRYWAGRGNCTLASSTSFTWATASIIVLWLPSCPTGQRRPMMGSRSLHDDKRPDARRRLHPYGDHARARLADGKTRTDREAPDHGGCLDRDLRRWFRPVHVPR